MKYINLSASFNIEKHLLFTILDLTIAYLSR